MSKTVEQRVTRLESYVYPGRDDDVAVLDGLLAVYRAAKQYLATGDPTGMGAAVAETETELEF